MRWRKDRKIRTLNGASQCYAALQPVVRLQCCTDQAVLFLGLGQRLFVVFLRRGSAVDALPLLLSAFCDAPATRGLRERDGWLAAGFLLA